MKPDSSQVITSDLELHRAFTKTIPLPVAILEYKALGMNPYQIVYLIHILAAKLQSRVVNVPEIAGKMGVDPRTLRKYNSWFRQRGLMPIVPKIDGGIQTENHYDLNKILDFLHEEISTKHDNITRILDQLSNQETADPNLIEQLIAAWRGVGDLGSGGVGDLGSGGVGDLGSGGDRSLPPKGVGDLGSGDNDDDDPLHDHTHESNHHHHSQNGFKISDLESIGFTKQNAVQLYAAACKFYGGTENGRSVISGWLDYIEENEDRLTNPAGFLWSKIRAKEEAPPLPQNETKQHIPEYLKDIVKR